MITYFEKRHNSLSYRILSAFIAFTFIFSLVLPPGYAQFIPQTLLNLPAPGMMVTPTSGFAPAMVTGITIHPDNPLRFDFIMDRGQSGLAGEPLKEEYTKMIKYFMASLTVPEDELWVNLSPYEKDRMVPQGLGDTEMGRDMLAQDYLLKQLTASLMYPEKELGKEFWNKVYKEAQEKFGTTEIPVNTFNKVWIVPDEALVYEQGTSAFVIKSRLGVMLEQDYKAMSHKDTRSQGHNDMGDAVTATEGSPRQRSDVVTTGIIREVIIPAIEQEINEGKNFASLRQIYNALILATWYKQRLKDSLLGKVYVDQNKTRGIDTQDKGINQKIYGQYIESFKRGVYNFIKEDVDPATQEIIPRKYFSGGMAWKLGGLKTVGALALGTLLSFGSPDFGNASAFAAAAMGGNKDGVTTEFVDNAQQGDVGTAIVVKEGAVQPVLLTGMWGKWVEERRLRQEEQRKFYEEMGGDWGLWQQEQYRKTYERLMVLSTTELIDVIKQEGYPTLGVGADILAERKDRSTVKPLIELYRKYLPTEAWQKEGPFYARADFVSAIGRIGGDEAKRFLQETVKNDPSPTVRDVAKQKLLSLSTKSIAGEDDWGQRQEERYQKTYDRLVVLLTAEIINVISQEGYPTLGVGANILAERKDLAAVKPLIELYREYLPTETWQKEGPFYARADLVSAIGRIGGDEAKRFLQETVKNDPSSTVRDVAKQQLLRLSSEPASSPLSKEEGARRIGDLFNDLREMGGFRVPEVVVGWMEAAGIDFARYAEGGKIYDNGSFNTGENISLWLGGTRAVVMTKDNLQNMTRDLIERDPDTAGDFLEEMESAVAHFQTRASVRDRIDSLVEQQEELMQKIEGTRGVITGIGGEIREKGSRISKLSQEERAELQNENEAWKKALKEMSGLVADLRDVEKELAELRKKSGTTSSPATDLEKLAWRLDVAPNDVDGVIEEYARAVGEIVERIPVVLTSSKQRKAVDLFMDPSSRPADVIIGLIYKQEYTSKERIDELRGDAWKMVEGPGLGISVDGVGPMADFFRGEKGLENLYGKTVAEDLRGDFRLLRELLATRLPGLTLTYGQISDKTAIRNVIKDTILASSSPVSFKGISPEAGEKLFDMMPLTDEERSIIEVVTVETGRGVLHERQAFVVRLGGRQLKVYLTPKTVKALEEDAVKAGNSLEKTIGEGFDRLDDGPTDIEDVLGEVRMAGEGVDVSSSPMTGDTFRKGGIDLNPALLDLQIRRDGNGVPLPLPMQPIEHMHIEGFLPIIINVTPITNLPMLLGLADTEQDADEITPAMKARHEDLYGS